MKRFLLFLLFVSSTFSQESYVLKINRLEIPFNNYGDFGNITGYPGEDGKFDSTGFLCAAGFLLSGKNADTLWASGMAASSFIGDYQPGNIDSDPFDPRNNIYIVSEHAFANSWQKWKYAVDLGADFYDGNGDGVYDPIDLNGNNRWDTDEDRPDIMGYFTAWCVYNDGVPAEKRKYKTQPLGIEIHQTVFAFYMSDNSDARSSTFFVRYKIINTGKVSDVLDSVYFSGWSDTDIGEVYWNDLSGCDTIQNAGFMYNQGDDPEFGINPPAHFVKILQGPYAYIPGETFIDNNSNGSYEEGIDTPVDTAFNYMGEVRGIDTIVGAKNLGMTSFTQYYKALDPSTIEKVRYLMVGKNQAGNYVDPCTLFYGNVYGEDCNKVNPVFFFSGDPVTKNGWINTNNGDQRMMANTGPFKLEVNKPVTIIVAHIVGRGTDSLNSITVAREFSRDIDVFNKSNFTDFPVSVEDENANQLPLQFRLYQNYPNPFNPTTKIKYEISKTGLVTLKVYDVLGREVATLVNEEKPSGIYEVEFDGSNLSSGVYFYRMRAGDFIDTKKFVLIK
jgi:hypothetical protein